MGHIGPDQTSSEPRCSVWRGLARGERPADRSFDVGGGYRLALTVILVVIATVLAWAAAHLFSGGAPQASGVTFAVAALIDEPW